MTKPFPSGNPLDNLGRAILGDTSVLFARQPIFNRKLDIVGFELLFRPATSDGVMPSGDEASSHVMLNAFTELPIEEVVEGQPAYINFTRTLILNPPPIHHRHIVIEVLEHLEFDEELFQALKRIKRQGYTIALDDFRYRPELARFVEIADIIKLDVLIMNDDEIRAEIDFLKDHQIKLLAEKVETTEMYERCKELGFHYFQGYFLSKPQIVKGRKTKESKQSVVQLIAKLQMPNVEIEEIVSAISTDPVLSLKLLRLINSSFFGLASEITSIRHAVTLLGIQRIRSWATLLVLASGSDTPVALTINSLNRARLCQLIGMKILQSDESRTESFFTVGLLSTLDAFLNMSLEEVLPGLNLSEEMQSAIVKEQGTMGLALATAKRCERANWDNIDWKALTKFHVTPESIESFYVDSIAWTRELLSHM